MIFKYEILLAVMDIKYNNIRNFVSKLGCFCNENPNNKIAYNAYLFLCKIVY